MIIKLWLVGCAIMLVGGVEYLRQLALIASWISEMRRKGIANAVDRTASFFPLTGSITFSVGWAVSPLTFSAWIVLAILVVGEVAAFLALRMRTRQFQPAD